MRNLPTLYSHTWETWAFALLSVGLPAAWHWIRTKRREGGWQAVVKLSTWSRTSRDMAQSVGVGFVVMLGIAFVFSLVKSAHERDMETRRSAEVTVSERSRLLVAEQQSKNAMIISLKQSIQDLEQNISERDRILQDRDRLIGDKDRDLTRALNDVEQLRNQLRDLDKQKAFRNDIGELMPEGRRLHLRCLDPDFSEPEANAWARKAEEVLRKHGDNSTVMLFRDQSGATVQFPRIPTSISDGNARRCFFMQTRLLRLSQVLTRLQ